MESLGQQLGVSGAYERDEKSQYAVPMEAAEEHFHLMPSRPSVEEDEEEVGQSSACPPPGYTPITAAAELGTRAAHLKREL